MSAEQDAATVRRYTQLLREEAAGADDGGIADHQCEILWSFARAISRQPLPAHLAVLRRVSLALLRDAGRRLCDRADRLSISDCPEEREHASALRELGGALLEMPSNYEHQG